MGLSSNYLFSKKIKVGSFHFGLLRFLVSLLPDCTLLKASCQKKFFFFYIFFSGFVFRGVSGIFLILFNLCRHLSYNSCSGGQADKKESLIKAQTLSKKGNDQIKNFHSPKIKNSLELKQCDWKPPLVVFNWL